MNSRLSSTELRKFGLTVGALFVVLFGLLIPWKRHAHFPLWPWIIALIFFVPALFTPRLLHYPYLVWERIGQTLGWINSRIVLNILFFLVFVPAGTVARLCKWDPLKRKFDPDARSYRVLSPSQSPADMEKPY